MAGVREALAKIDNSYAGVDVANAVRLGSTIWLLGALLAFVLLPLAPPTDRFGNAGWIAAVALVLVAAVSGWAVRKLGETIAPREMLVQSYLSLVVIAAMVWLTGGIGSPWLHIFFLNVMWTVAVHPPRPAFAVLALFVPVVLAPLVYDHASRAETVHLVTEVGVWMVFAGAYLFLMASVRAQRLGLRREGERARHLARVDQLTGLQNRRAFDEAIASELHRARAASDHLSVLVGDVDEFKEINDSHGHLEGDRVLKEVAEAISGAIRGPDAAYRWGGDEFAVILPGTGAAGAEHVAERVRNAVTRIRTPDGEPVCLQVGIGELRPGIHTAAALLGEADRALLRAKAGDVALARGLQG